MASLKALLVSAGAVSIAVAIGTFVPSMSDPPRFPPALDSLLSWFRPPYLFVVINGIIITIAATSRCFHHVQPEDVTVAEEIVLVEATPAFDEFKDFEEKRVVVVGNGGGFGGFGGGDGCNGDCEEEGRGAFGRSASTPRRRVDSSEKALASPRLVRRKATDGDHLQGGKALRRSARRSNESMENVCKAKAQAGAMSMTRRMKADDTDRQNSLLEPSPRPWMGKSVTFNDRTDQPRKERILAKPSLGENDEFNRQVEAFINKVKEEMRLQRDESMNQLKEMVNRGTW
ncbi:uncharacterized protein LOC125316621 [Rhodamnia argentea]|uniref:Uncharacterized protein LOC125316621 n=1 Tax=Rhodamnia argentea TaxID=178133 RepID=A0ABM3HXR6_9MYRT|nr:uncharacterized protein LOC125316621 [Rhodamnia argentea]